MSDFVYYPKNKNARKMTLTTIKNKLTALKPEH